MQDDLKGQVALVTGAGRDVGRDIALGLAARGAAVAVNYNSSSKEAQGVADQIKKQGGQGRVYQADVTSYEAVRTMVQAIKKDFGRIDILVNNAAHQASFSAIEDMTDEEWERTLRVNLSAMFYITKAAVAHMPPGSSIINTASVNADSPNPHLLAYATTKGAIQNFTAGLAQLLAERELRANTVAPGPVWTPLIPSTMPEEAVAHFGEQVPMKRPAQPCELAPVYVLLASDEASYVSGATVAVTGGKPIL
jgi:NAD(P)-dependent dehydrogenase (short-subunit alcohol dehydrogenase family)